ncbi:maleylacetoacetate isomerase [Vibrio nitrifigilis]|uniref:Maleylacetoacetate isomerase n=1 Tax=Vibrio nitrifigilis TaxID=2789781 RepID=A0ABS0GE15_9VIBR|nr:maleylacetoacetate isomerase [Vibrio nitrifigilis]MBF9000580.1 maleylacetoacetate isomerase [Vibrio nitrifigilis]
MSELTLYSYWRSSASYRVRIVLNLKGLDYVQMPINILGGATAKSLLNFKQINPTELVPVLIDGPLVLNQSLSIMQYLDETYRQVPLLPNDVGEKYRLLSMAQDITCDIHPLNNLRVLRYLDSNLRVSQDEKGAWYHHWIQVGFAALESRLKETAGKYSFGDAVTMLDACLVPQVYNAERFDVDLTPYPIIQRIQQALRSDPAFIKALPENQPDARLV